MKAEHFENPTAWHSTPHDFDKFEDGHASAGSYGFHFGTLSQALTRNSQGYLLRCRLFVTDMKRKKDTGNWTQKDLKNISRTLFDGVVYLNRYEGIPKETLDSLQDIDLDRLSDTEFKRLVPMASDSWLLFKAHNIKVLKRIEIGSEMHKLVLDGERLLTNNPEKAIELLENMPANDLATIYPQAYLTSTLRTLELFGAEIKHSVGTSYFKLNGIQYSLENGHFVREHRGFDNPGEFNSETIALSDALVFDILRETLNSENNLAKNIVKNMNEVSL